MGKKKKIKEKIDPFGQIAGKSWLAILIFIVLGVLIYSNTLDNKAVFDDHVWQNYPAVQDMDPAGLFAVNKFRVITFFTFAVNYAVSGYDLASYHIGNILIHIVNTLLVWLMIRTIFQTPALKDSYSNKLINLISFFGALVFLVHPLQTQAVTYVYQRLASLSALFYFISVLFYLKARLSQDMQKRIFHFTITLVSMLAAFLSKENTFTLPVMFLLIEVFLMKKKFKFRRIHLILIIAGIALFAGIMLFTDISSKITQHYKNYNGESVNSCRYFITQGEVYLKYFQLLFVPIGQNVDHHIPIDYSIKLINVVGFLVIAGLMVLGAYLYNRNRLASFGIFFFFLTISIEASFIPIMDVIMEHRLYLPMAGFSMAAAGGAYSIMNNKRNKRKAWITNTAAVSYIFAAIVVIFSVMTFARNMVWQNELTLWSDAVEKSPEKARPWNGRGLAYYNRGEYQKALADFNRALEIYDEFYLAYQNRGIVYLESNKFDSAINDFTRAIEIEPRNHVHYKNRGNAYLKAGSYQEAVNDYSKYMQEYPNDFSVYFNRGKSYLELGNVEKAMIDFNKAEALKPNDGNICKRIGDLLNAKKEYEKSIIFYNLSINRNNSNEKTYYNRAASYYYSGQYDKAIQDYTRALQINQNMQPAYKFRGLSYLRNKQYKKALKDYNKSINLNSKDYQAYYYRGNLYIQMNEYKKALSDFKRVLKLKPNHKPAKDSIRKILKSLG